MDLVTPTGKQTQEGFCLVAVHGLAKDASPDCHDCVGCQHDLAVRAGDGLRFLFRHAQAVGARQFARPRSLVDVRGSHVLGRDAKLSEHLKPPLRGRPENKARVRSVHLNR